MFSRSNVYQALHNTYEEYGGFGTACVLLERNFDRVLHMHVQTAGQYYLGTDPFGQVNTVYREFEMTVAQLVEEFGIERMTPQIKTLAKEGRFEQHFTVIHAVEPRGDRQLDKMDKLNMPWRSVYFFRGERRDARTRGILREGGYREFPYLVPRWSVTERNSWGFGPGHEALPHCKRLQNMVLSQARSVAFGAEPPMQGPPSLAGRSIKMQPGGYTPVAASNGQKIESLFEVRTDMPALESLIATTQDQVQRAMYNDLFLLLMNSRRAKTATEVDELHEEKMLMLGPALERMHNELLRPLVERAFRYMDEAGLLPAKPSELQNVPLQVEFVSMLQQLQQASGVVTMERFMTMIAAGAEAFPEMLDIIDPDNVARDYADNLAIDPDNLRDPDEVARVRQARNEAQAAMEQAEAEAVQAKANRDNAAAQQDAPSLDQTFNGYTL